MGEKLRSDGVEAEIDMTYCVHRVYVTLDEIRTLLPNNETLMAQVVTQTVRLLCIVLALPTKITSPAAGDRRVLRKLHRRVAAVQGRRVQPGQLRQAD